MNKKSSGGFFKSDGDAIVNTVGNLINSGARKVSCYVRPDYVVTATRPHRPDKRAKSFSIVVTMGKPNYRGRLFVKACKKAGEPFPVRKLQIKHWKK